MHVVLWKQKGKYKCVLVYPKKCVPIPVYTYQRYAYKEGMTILHHLTFQNQFKFDLKFSFGIPKKFLSLLM